MVRSKRLTEWLNSRTPDTYNRWTAASERRSRPAGHLAENCYFLASFFSHLPASRLTLAGAVPPWTEPRARNYGGKVVKEK